MHLGRYRLGELLGSGGAGRVYEAWREGPGGVEHRVALKVLHAGSEGLQREARVGGLLRHRHLVDVYEIGEADGTWFCAMELCPYGSLGRFAPLPPRAVVDVGLQVCEALAYAHADLGLVHLDIKPDNLLLGEHGEVKLADFGIARADEESVRAAFSADGLVRGTPAYMAPEQARGERLDPRADLYALGVTLVELATGRRATHGQTFEFGTETGPTSHTIGRSVFGVAEAAPDVPEWLTGAVLPCLAADPDDRWPDMAALAEALAALDIDGPGLREHLDLGPAPQVATDGLPEVDTPLLGRHEELAAALEVLMVPGLLTLKGPAGAGKSRLAVEVARMLRDDLEGEAWFCDLAAVTSERGLLRVVARAVGVRLPERGAVDAVGRALAGRSEPVLVLDNFEQITELAPILQSWLRLAPNLRAIVTSRVRLELPGESSHELGPLPLAAAGELLLARAKARGFTGNTADLEPLARGLDGLPLALELAAGRLGVLSPEDVLARLDRGILRAATEGRHATLDAALGLSWEMLDEPSRRALVELTVFSGGFTLSAAEAVIGETAHLDTLDAHSLLRRQGDRLDLFVSVAQFAAGQDHPRTDAAARHADYFAALGSEDALGALVRHGGMPRRTQLARELDNVDAACRWAIAQGEGPIAARCLRALWAHLVVAGPYSSAMERSEQVLGLDLPPQSLAEALMVSAEAHIRTGQHEIGRARAERALALDPSGRLKAEALHLVGMGLQNQGRLDEARASYERARQVYRAHGDRRGEAVALGSMGIAVFLGGDLSESLVWIQRSLGLARRVGDLNLAAAAVGNMGIVCRTMGRREEAGEHYAEALALRQEVGDVAGAARVLASHAVLRQESGFTEQARQDYLEAIALCRRVGDLLGEAVALGNLGTLLEEAGESGPAEAHYLQSIEGYRTLGDKRDEGIMVGNLATLYIEMGRTEEAVATMRTAIALAEEGGDRRHRGHWRVELSRLVDPSEARRLLAEAAELLAGTEDPSMMANLRCGQGHLALRDGNLATARERLAAARAIAPEGDDMSRLELDRLAEAVREATEGETGRGA